MWELPFGFVGQINSARTSLALHRIGLMELALPGRAFNTPKQDSPQKLGNLGLASRLLYLVVVRRANQQEGKNKAKKVRDVAQRRCLRNSANSQLCLPAKGPLEEASRWVHGKNSW